MLQAAGFGAVAAVYFGLFIVIGAFMFANIIVGVVVTNLQETARQGRAGETKNTALVRTAAAARVCVTEPPTCCAEREDRRRKARRSHSHQQGAHLCVGGTGWIFRRTAF
jgi:hypothetical protein